MLVLYIYMMCTMVVSFIALSHIPDSDHANLNPHPCHRVTTALTLFSTLVMSDEMRLISLYGIRLRRT